MSNSRLPILLSPEILAHHIYDNSVLVVYVGKEEKYLEGHIPNAMRISHSDLNHGVAPKAGHLPAIGQLESLFRSIGLNNEHHIVSYDDEAGTAAARLFWLLEAMGHRKVSFLDGGYLSWTNLNLPVSTDLSRITEGSWKAHPDPEVLATKDYVYASIDNADIQILDARTEEEHIGLKSASDRKGHIPGAILFQLAVNPRTRPRSAPESFGYTANHVKAKRFQPKKRNCCPLPDSSTLLS